MNNNIKLPALLLAALTAIGFMIPQTATARDRHADDRGNPPIFANYDRERHQYRQQPQHYRHQQQQPDPRWYRRYQRSQGYGYYYRPLQGHHSRYMDKHALKKHYRRMEHQPRHSSQYDSSPSGGYSDSNIHFRIDYRN